MVTADDLLTVFERCGGQLSLLAPRNWDTPIPGMDWTVRDTVENLVDGIGFFTLHLLAESMQRLRVDIRCHGEISNEAVLDVLAAEVRALARAGALMPESTRAYHPHGSADAAGFMALACAELLGHTHDACRGMDTPFEVDTEVTRDVVARLFPGVAGDGDRLAALLWATGRLSLDGREDVGDDWTYNPGPPEARIAARASRN